VYTEKIGNGADIQFTVTPGFSTEQVLVQVRKVSSKERVTAKDTIGVNGNTQVQIDFAAGDAPGVDEYEVVIVGPNV